MGSRLHTIELGGACLVMLVRAGRFCWLLVFVFSV